MPHVMVPVPEDDVAQVMQFVLRATARASVEPWDEPSLRALHDRLDDASRSVLALAARTARAGKEVTAEAAADLVALDVRSVVGIMCELDDRAREEGRAPLLVWRETSEERPERPARRRRLVTMEDDVAVLVLAIDRGADAAHGT